MFKQKISQQQRVNMILNGNIYKSLIILAIPTLLMGFVQILMPFSDSLFINRSNGDASIAIASAISYSQPIIGAIGALSQGLAVAASAMIGQLQGQKNVAQSKQLMLQFIIVGFVLSLIAIPIAILLAIPISNGVTKEISHHVFEYISLYVIVFPFLFLDGVYVGIKNGLGKPEDTFLRSILLLIAKIIFNFIFVFSLHLGIKGAVLASLSSEAALSIWLFYDLFFKPSDYKLTFKNFQFDIKLLSPIVKLAIPAMLNSFLINVGVFLINKEVQDYGKIALNAMGIAGSITNICFVLPQTIGSVVTTMISMNIGANNVDRSKKILRSGIVVSTIISCISVPLVIYFSSSLTKLFTDNIDVLGIANEALNTYTYSVFAFGIVMVIQGAYIALGKTRLPLYAGILRIWLFRYIFILIFQQYMGVYAIFYGNLFSNYLTAFILLLTLTKLKWESAIK